MISNDPSPIDGKCGRRLMSGVDDWMVDGKERYTGIRIERSIVQMVHYIRNGLDSAIPVHNGSIAS